MEIFQLSAGVPKSSEIPINLQNFTFNKSIIEWQLETLKLAYSRFNLTILTGYKSNLYK